MTAAHHAKRRPNGEARGEAWADLIQIDQIGESVAGDLVTFLMMRPISKPSMP